MILHSRVVQQNPACVSDIKRNQCPKSDGVWKFSRQPVRMDRLALSPGNVLEALQARRSQR